MKKTILYIHGKGGSHLEAAQYQKSCPGYTVVGADYEVDFPWVVKDRLRAAYDAASRDGGQVVLLANSIGAYFAMDALGSCGAARALFISPVLDMERLILDMMGWTGVTEEELRTRGEIPTDFGETLSWEYLRYVREHPVRWDIPTEILYADGDHLTVRQTVDAFAAARRAGLTVMEGGEHWFHTGEQLAFLDRWLRDRLGERGGEPAPASPVIST